MRLTRARIEQALHPLDAVDGLPERGECGRREPCPAAVLVPLERFHDGWRILLTVRTERLSTHAGQISFPGGRQDPGDGGPVAAALRETEEETGIAPEFVEVAGLLDRHHTVTGFRMTPVVGFLRPGYRLRPRPSEVADLFWMPLERALDPARYRDRSVVYQGRKREFHAQTYGGHVVWGATAAILLGLGEKLAGMRAVSDHAIRDRDRPG